MMIIVSMALILSGIAEPHHKRINKKPLPPIPSLGLRLVPTRLGYQFVRVEIFNSAFASAAGNSGPSCELAVTYLVELADALVRIEHYQRVINASGDTELRTEADLRIAKCLKEYREGLSMTPMQRYERAKRMMNETDPALEELSRIRIEKLERRIQEYLK